MKYQIKVLNTPTITIDNKVAKVGDWFDDESVIVWSKDNQAMRVVSEDNKVYTLSAKLYKESKSKKFSDFIIYTKPLAARGSNNADLIEQLAECFDNDFILLDELVIDLSEINLPDNCYFQLNTISEENNHEISYIATPKHCMLNITRQIVGIDNTNDVFSCDFQVLFFTSPQNSHIISDSLHIECYPLETE